MQIFKNISKTLKTNKSPIVTLLTVTSILVSSSYIQSTSSVLSDSAQVRATNSADIWVVPSTTSSASDFQSAKVSWNKAGSYTSYTVEYSTSSSFTSVQSVTVNGLTTTISKLTSGTTYYFRVRPTTSPTGTWKSTSVGIPAWDPKLVGTSWSPYMATFTGDLNKDTSSADVTNARDLIAVQISGSNIGSLWLYPGYNTGAVSSTSRVQIGSGFSPLYPIIFGSWDWNGDGRDDFMAIDGSGILWLYTAKSTYSADPYNARVQIGSGWGSMSQVSGVGDVTNDAYNDLIAVDSSGNLRIYPGATGTGFGATIILGSGWGSYSAVLGIGDINKDGNNDLLAIDSTGQGWYYSGTGVKSSAAFDPRVKIPNMTATASSRFIGSGDMDADGYWDVTEISSTGNMYHWKGADIATALGY